MATTSAGDIIARAESAERAYRRDEASALWSELIAAPTAMFSVLNPRTHIPPHTGSANTRVIAHLPLVLPADCAFRVGNDTRAWDMHRAWVFNDTIEHEAWNNSNDTRVILIFDVWNPLLSQAERDMVTQMMTACMPTMRRTTSNVPRFERVRDGAVGARRLRRRCASWRSRSLANSASL